MATDRRMAGFWMVWILALTALTLGGGARAWAIENGAVPVTLSLETPATSETGEVLEAQAAPALDSEAELDPWEKFNEPMFRFNKEVDRLIVKPLATGWDRALPDSFQRGLHNAFDNLAVVRRVMNNLFQGKPERAAREVARFTINSTIGYVGFLDVAKDYFGIQQADEDFGQTLGVWGAKPGPYLVLPLVPEPMTVRDGAGKVVDGFMYPPSWIWPFGVSAGLYVTDGINERSLNLDRFQRVEESVVDLYSAVRNAYLQRRAAAIRE
ncbi:MAG TPA: VacJ family lipoprotein [Candidatus Binatia bacterium]